MNYHFANVSAARPSPAKRVLCALLAAILVLLGLQAVEFVAPPKAQATYATGGSGEYRGLIDWLEWGTHNQVVRNGRVATTQRTIGGQTLLTTCSLSGISGGGVDPWSAYRPGTWTNDAFDNVYNIGGQNNANQLIAGLTNTNNGQLVNLSVSCQTTLDGRQAPMAGLVIADAEASNARQSEYIQATPHQNASWRLIERFRSCSHPMNSVVWSA